MNWNSHQFIWLDWVIIAAGIIGVTWAVWRLASGRTGRYRSQIGCRYGTLGNARLDDSGSGLAVCPFLSAFKHQNG